MSPPTYALTIGAICGVLAAALSAWILLQWLGFGYWFLALVVPLCMVTMQAVGSNVATILTGIKRL